MSDPVSYLDRFLGMPELLVEVFSYFPPLDSQGSWSERVGKRRPRILDVTGVCRKWREIAVGCPVLCTNITIIGPDWLSVCIERSKALPLTVTCHGFVQNHPFSKLKRIVCVLLGAFPRIRTLSVSDGEWLLLVFEAHTESPMPGREVSNKFIHGGSCPILAYDRAECTFHEHWQPTLAATSSRTIPQRR